MKSISNGGCLFCLRMDLVFVSTIARGVELSIFPSTLLHTLERCTFRSVRFPSLAFRASQKWIRNCLRPGGNKKLRAMIRNRSLPLPLVQTRSTPPHVFSCLVVCLPRYFARRHTGNMRPMERTASVGEADPYARS